MTSALDAATEQRLLKQVISGLQGSTLIFITHRLAAAGWSDRVVVMKKGEVVETGTYAGLSASDGWFGELCRQAGDVQANL